MVSMFFKKLALLSVPFVLGLAVPLVVMWRAGEFATAGSVAERQLQSPETIYLTAYSNGWRRLKALSTRLRQPEVVAVGTSRVMQFRSGVFHEPPRFYNAGGAVYEAPHFRDFLHNVTADSSYRPKILIVGVDQYFLNPQYHASTDLQSAVTDAQHVADAKTFERTWKRVYADLLAGKISIPAVFASAREGKRIGMGAIMNGEGFRVDGSFYYAREIRKFVDEGTPPLERFSFQFSQIKAGRDQFLWGDRVSPAQVAEVGRFLDECRAAGIHVIGFLPPYAHAVYARMRSMPQYRYLDEVEPAMRAQFAARGFPFFDFSDLASLGATDVETIDGLHGSEKAYTRILLRLAESDAELRRYVDPARVRELIDRSPNDFEVFANHSAGYVATTISRRASS